MSEVKVFQPEELDGQYWRALQGMARVALAESLVAADRDQPDTDAQKLVGWDDPDRYYDSHLDPNTERGRRYNVKQEYTQPRVAVAFDDNGQRIGFAYSAHNVSGPWLERRAKLLTPSRRYLWLRDVAVLPNHQEEGIATELITDLLSDASVDERQPVSAYIWPQLMPQLDETLRRHGFEDRGGRDVRLFETEEAIAQHFMVAPSAGGLLAQLRG